MTTSDTVPQQAGAPAAGRYRLDPAHSSVTFRTRHLSGLGAVSGTMAVTSGEITIDPAVPHATVTALLSAATFDTGSRARDRDVRAAKFLHTDSYPHITFRAAALTRSAGRWMLAGELTVRDATSPVTLAIESVEPAGAGFQARATARIDRYALGITAAKGMAARYLNITLTAIATPAQAPQTAR
jgi:polyisoprenoid-binding protein YceI